MKKYSKRTMWTVFCIFTCLSMFFVCAPTAMKPEKLAHQPKVERYEDKIIGFSIEYDADKLTKDPGPAGPFVFRKVSDEGLPVLSITVGQYPPGTALEDTADLIARSLSRMAPGSIIREVYNKEMIKLTDGTEANYFEIKWNSGEMALISAFVAAKKTDRLIVVTSSDNEKGSMESLTAMVKSLRLDVKVDEIALKARGFAQDGKFIRTDAPAFTLEYPKSFQMKPLQANQIFRAGNFRGLPLMEITTLPLKANEDIEKQLKASAEAYANALKSIGSDIKIISQNPIDNYEKFNAYQIQIVWKFQGPFPLTTIIHLIAKENKAIQLAGHTAYGIDELLDIFKTINLNQ